MGTILISPHRQELEEPMVFLGGPISGALDWHSDAIAFLQVNSALHIISPRRARDERTPLTEAEIKEQAKWECEYIQKTCEKGGYLFWFPKPISSDIERTALFQLASALEKVSDLESLSVGIEEGFPERDELCAMLYAFYPDIVIHGTLSETCDALLRYIRTQYL